MSDDAPATPSADLRALLHRLHDAFAAHRDEIDDLNVFPVPDGDTGTNLLLTVRTTLEELDRAAPDDDGLPQAIVRAAMLGARGNSGVIFSQVLRALAETVQERRALDADTIQRALATAREHAYAAVSEPVEGTILTAISAAADAARGAGRRTPAELTRRVVERVRGAVARTTDQLQALRDAGVVDAGARGFELFCQVLHEVVSGEAAVDADRYPPPPVRRGATSVGERETGSEEFRFEVQYLLTAAEDVAPELKDRLQRLGDSVVVVGSGGLFSVHVHTNDVGAAIEEGLELGRPSRVQVTYFPEQIAERDRARAGGDAAEGGDREPAAAGLGCVAVLPGPGLRGLAEDHGAVVVAGAAGDLPSVSALVDGIAAAHRGRVAVLPGHPNVVPVARQAARVAADDGTCQVEVVEAAVAPTACLSALSVYDRDGEPDEVLAAMAEAAAAVRSGEVVAAVRDADTPVGHVRRGQLLAVAAGDVVAAADDPVAALRSVVEALGIDDAEVVTVVVGADVAPDERDRVASWLEEVLGGRDLDLVDGGQRPARYLVGVE